MGDSHFVNKAFTYYPNLTDIPVESTARIANPIALYIVTRALSTVVMFCLFSESILINPGSNAFPNLRNLLMQDDTQCNDEIRNNKRH